MAIETSTFTAGQQLFSEGTDATSLYLVKSGRISIRKVVDDGYVEIAQVGPNQILGEVGFFDSRPRSADAVAITYSEVVQIPYATLRPMFDPSPEYLKKIMIGLATRLRDADDMIRELKGRLGERDGAGQKRSDAPETVCESETSKILRQTKSD